VRARLFSPGTMGARHGDVCAAISRACNMIHFSGRSVQVTCSPPSPQRSANSTLAIPPNFIACLCSMFSGLKCPLDVRPYRPVRSRTVQFGSKMVAASDSLSAHQLSAANTSLSPERTRNLCRRKTAARCIRDAREHIPSIAGRVLSGGMDRATRMTDGGDPLPCQRTI
jgi:hypothetical protein